jgi:ankyrin repeat protein
MLSDDQKMKILDFIYANDIESLSKYSTSMNFLYAHPETSLDDLISPLACASYLGRREILEQLLANPSIDLNIQTIDNGFTPLCAACVSGNYEIVRMLCEAGAEVDKPNFFGIPSNKRTDSTHILLFKT